MYMPTADLKYGEVHVDEHDWLRVGEIVQHSVYGTGKAHSIVQHWTGKEYTVSVMVAWRDKREYKSVDINDLF